MKVEDLRGWMSGEHCLVVAPGPSAWEVPRWRLESHRTIACNRAVALARPDFAVCREPPGDHCWRVVRAASPPVVFAHVEPRNVKGYVLLPRDARGLLGANPTMPPPFTLDMSPFWAAAVAVHMGFQLVALLGVDLADGDWARDPARLERCCEEWGRLREAAASRGCRIVNLNPASKLSTVPRGAWSEVLTR